MLNACYLGTTFLRLLRSTQTYLEAWPKTWALDQLSRHALRQCVLLICPNLTLATITSIKVTDQKTGVPFGFRNPTQKIWRFIDTWRIITSDPEILSIVSGYKIPLRYKPVQHSLPITSSNQANAHLIDVEVETLLTKGAITQVSPSKEGFFSCLFLVPKKGGSFRLVIDLSFLNKFVESLHFQMENISCLKTVLHRGDYMTTLDLKDAYLSVPIHRDSQKFLQFLWRNKCYAFQGLCFGWNTGPRVFTKLLKPIAACLRKQGVCMILYLDDFLILGSSYQEVQRNMIMAVTL